MTGPRSLQGGTLVTGPRSLSAGTPVPDMGYPRTGTPGPGIGYPLARDGVPQPGQDGGYPKTGYPCSQVRGTPHPQDNRCIMLLRSRSRTVLLNNVSGGSKGN